MNFNKSNSFQNNMALSSDILIVDDVPQNIQLLSLLLKKNGYQVRGVNSGAMALNALAEKIPELILLDVMMPEMDGYEVCQKLQEIPTFNEIPVIFLSALENTEDKQRAFEVGGVDYIGKPFKFEEVLMRVKNHLKLKSAQNQINQLNEKLEERVKKRTAELEREIVRHQKTQEKLSQMAFYDCLTGLPNRTFFLELLQNSIERSKRDLHYSFSVLFLDCDRFKLVNDSLGHQSGDQILKQVAYRLKSCLRPTDTIARLGGDEFIILLEDLNNLNYTELLAQRLIKKLEVPFWIYEREIFLGASVGVILETNDYQLPETILRDADMAMYKAKESGKGCYEVFQPEMHLLAQHKLQLETDLRLAVERNEFTLYYQPIFSFHNNCVKGFEALIRWKHPQKGLLSPGYFMPIAEETGLIIPMGIWVLKEACRQLKIWQEQNFTGQNLTMNVNLSVKQFSQENLIAEIDKILEQTQIDSKYLHLEITETAIMNNSSLAKDILQQLRDRKIGLSIDDFGTGYSSLSYLHRFPVNQLKIDRSFIQMIQDQTDSSKIIETIMSLGKNLNMKIVAEGIENQEQFNKLQSLGCDFGQGYFFSKPLHRDLITNLLRNFGQQIQTF